MSNRPGGELAKRPLQFFWICDVSGSMRGKKIESLNFAIKESIPEMQRVANENPNASVEVRAIMFAESASWHVSQPTDVHSFVWSELSATGRATDLGNAIDLVAEALDMSKMPERGLPPVIVLVSDGLPTDNYKAAFDRLVRLPWGAKSVRVSVGIGDDAQEDVLQEFMGGDPRENKPLMAKNVQDLVKFIKWASTVPLAAASKPASLPEDNEQDTHIPLPPAPTPSSDPIDPTEVF